MEQWQRIPTAPGYEVSDEGRIRSDNGVLRPFKSGKGYLIAELWRNNERRRTGVHRLVALAFLPNPNNLPEVNHKNWDKTDNRLDNLEWITAAANKAHGLQHPAYLASLYQARVILTGSTHGIPAHHEEWKRLHDSGVSYKHIGMMYGVTKQAVHKAVAAQRPSKPRPENPRVTTWLWTGKSHVRRYDT